MPRLEELSEGGISSIRFAGTEICVLGEASVTLTEDGETAGYQIVRN